MRSGFAGVQASSPDVYREVIVPYLDSLKAQSGRRVPHHAFDGLRQRIDREMGAAKENRDAIVKKAASAGSTIEIAELREKFEASKAEYQGPDRQAYMKQIDHFLFTLEAKYGTTISVDEAMRLSDKLESDIRAKEKPQDAARIEPGKPAEK